MGIASYENFVDLANAIIAAAATDYCVAYQTLSKNPNNRDAKWKLAEVKGFFRSRWYGVLTTLDGNALMEQLEDQCDKHEKYIVYRRRGEQR